MAVNFIESAQELAKRRKVVASQDRKFSIHPRNGWVLVRKLVLEDEITEGGVIVDNTTARTLRAEVVEASVPFGKVSTDLAPGDIVLINAMCLEMEDLERMTGDKNLVMLRDEEIYSLCTPIEE